MYEDAVRQLRAWKQQGLKLYVFSSGSVLAQKLLFSHTAWGDLTPLFSGYFGTPSAINANRRLPCHRRADRLAAVRRSIPVRHQRKNSMPHARGMLRFCSYGTALCCGCRASAARSFDAISF